MYLSPRRCSAGWYIKTQQPYCSFAERQGHLKPLPTLRLWWILQHLFSRTLGASDFDTCGSRPKKCCLALTPYDVFVERQMLDFT